MAEDDAAPLRAGDAAAAEEEDAPSISSSTCSRLRAEALLLALLAPLSNAPAKPVADLLARGGLTKGTVTSSAFLFPPLTALGADASAEGIVSDTVEDLSPGISPTAFAAAAALEAELAAPLANLARGFDMVWSKSRL
jgi:hypothetical protein